MNPMKYATLFCTKRHDIKALLCAMFAIMNDNRAYASWER